MIQLAYFKDGYAISEAIKLFINGEKDFKLKFEATRIDEIAYLLGKNKIDLLLVSGTAASQPLFEAIRKEFPLLKIIIIGSGEDDQYNQYKNYKTSSIIFLNKVSTGTLFMLIRNAVKNDAPGKSATAIEHRNISGAKLLEDPRKLLTRREREVLELLRSGHFRKRVADKLNVDLVTIHKHVNNCLQKTGHHKLEELFDTMAQLENRNF